LQNTEIEANLLFPFGIQKLKGFQLHGVQLLIPLTRCFALDRARASAPDPRLPSVFTPNFFDLASPLIASSTETEQHDKEYSEDMNILKSGVTTSQYFTNQQCICS